MNLEQKLKDALCNFLPLRDSIVEVLLPVISNEIERNVAQVEMSAGREIANLQGEIKALQNVIDRERRAHLRGW